MPRFGFGFVLCFGLVASALAQNAAKPVDHPAWTALAQLTGEWVGDGDGAPGQGSGAFRFTSELQGRVYVRKNFAEYPAAAGRAAFRHDDLLVVYRPEDGGAPRATYWDNEGHVIEYTVSVSEDRKTIVFVSAAADKQPRFRFTYEFTGKSAMKIRFEIAPPGAPEKFQRYIEAGAKKKVAE